MSDVTAQGLSMHPPTEGSSASQPFGITVEVDDAATEPELEGIMQAFARAGFGVRPRAVLSARSADPVPWVLYVTLGSPIATFFSTFAAETAKDAHAAVKQWVKDLWAARRDAASGSGTIFLQDVDSSCVVLQSTIPDHALDALRHLDWPNVSGDYLVWNEGKCEWLDPVKHPSDF